MEKNKDIYISEVIGVNYEKKPAPNRYLLLQRAVLNVLPIPDPWQMIKQRMDYEGATLDRPNCQA